MREGGQLVAAPLPREIQAGKGVSIRFKLDSDTWKKTVRKFIRETSKKLGGHHKAGKSLFFSLVEKVIFKTPVDTGMARGGWGALPGVKLPPANPIAGKPDQTAEGKKLSEFKDQSSPTKVKLVLTNRVPYIEFLENGTHMSLQAPFGMVAISERELAAELGVRKLPAAIEAVYKEAAIRSGLTEAAVSGRAGGIAKGFGLLADEGDA